MCNRIIEIPELLCRQAYYRGRRNRFGHTPGSKSVARMQWSRLISGIKTFSPGKAEPKTGCTDLKNHSWTTRENMLLECRFE
jgi:hypothetical protein